uniref:IS110 family transposase n=1 Tax=Caballeronia fortuita TaxID=1777138 RepID=UPI001FCA1D56|nr:IS110 family transposase [Caballeronia fortuita]
MTVPGTGLTLATVIRLQIGSTERFASAANFASYARCVERQYLINGKKKGEGNARNGNKYLACVFVEAANSRCAFAIGADTSISARTPKSVRSSPARPRPPSWRPCSHMLKKRKSFDMTRCFV